MSDISAEDAYTIGLSEFQQENYVMAADYFKIACKGNKKFYMLIGIEYFKKNRFAEAVPYLEQAKKGGEVSACLSLVGCYLSGEGEKLYINLAKAKENFGFCGESQPGYNELKNAIKEADERLNELIPAYMQFKEIKQRCLEAKKALMSPLLVSFLPEQELVQLVELADKLPNIEAQLMTLSMKVFEIQPDHDIIKEFLRKGGDLGLLCDPIEYIKQYLEVLIEVGTEKCKKILIDNTIDILLHSGKDLTELLGNLDDVLEDLLSFDSFTALKKNTGIYDLILGQLAQKWEEQNPEPKEESESNSADVFAAPLATSSGTSAAATAAVAAPSTSDSSDIDDTEIGRLILILFNYVKIRYGSLISGDPTDDAPRDGDSDSKRKFLRQNEEKYNPSKIYEYLLANYSTTLGRLTSMPGMEKFRKIEENPDLLEKLKEKIASKKTEAEKSQQTYGQTH